VLGHGPLSGGPISDPDDSTPDLTIGEDKVAQYLLNVDHPKGGPKAEFFIAHGYRPEATTNFLLALFDHGKPGHLVSETPTEFGIKYVYEGPMLMADGSTPRVRSVWHKGTDDVRRLLVTAYPF
jgi:hypothetical protein